MTIKIGLCGFTVGAAAYVTQFNVVEVLPASGDRYVMFNNIPRVGDARRFRALLS